MKNRYRITLASFLAYFVMSGMLAPIGIVMQPMAEYFDQPVTAISALFSGLTFGILAGADGCFSIAGIVCAWIAIFLVARGTHWAGTYQFVAMISAVVVLLSAISVFPANPQRADNVDSLTKQPITRWPPSIWLCIGALFLYTLGQSAMLWWLPSHLETDLGVPRARAGEVVGQFWSGMLVAQVFVAWWVLRTGVPRLVLIGATTTCLFSLHLWLYEEMDGLVILALIWGIANLGLLKIIISFATLMVSVPMPRLVSGLLLGATLGTAVSPLITSRIADLASPLRVLQFASGCYFVIFFLLLAAGRVGQLHIIPPATSADPLTGGAQS